MSSIVGWLGQSSADRSDLERMAQVCGLPQDAVATSLSGHPAGAATGPVGGGGATVPRVGANGPAR